MNGKREESAKNVPLLFVASPSAKDPTWEERSPGTETYDAACLCFYSEARFMHES